MAGSYILPQVRVFQEFAMIPNDITQNLNPVVIGPNYHLIRYSNADERALCSRGGYTGGATALLAWASTVAGSVNDEAWASVTLVNAYAKLTGTALAASARDVESSKSNKFELTLGSNKSLTSVGLKPGYTLQCDTAVQPGDYVAYGAGASRKYSKIISVGPGYLDAGERSCVVSDNATGEVVSGITVNLDEYTAGVSGHITLTIDADKKATYRSDFGVSSNTKQQLSGTAAALSRSKGVKVSIDSTVEAGVYDIAITLKEPYTRDTVEIADSIPSNTTSIDIYRVVPEARLAPAYFSADSSGVTVAATVKVKIDGVDRDVAKADAYLSQRSLITDRSDGVYSVSSDADILTGLGKITPDNPLAYGAHIMMLNCANTSIRYIALDEDSLDGWYRALDRASVTTEVYALCPLTESRAVIDAVVAHCNKLSSPEEKSWRIAFFSAPTPKVLDNTPVEEDGASRSKCTVSGSTLFCCTPDNATAASTGARFKSGKTASKGDTVVITTSGGAVTCKVEEVVSDTMLALDKSVTGATSACEFTLTHTRGAAEYAEAVAATSTSFHNHRAYNVFPGKLKTSDGVTVSGMYAAAAVCALACSVAPQQPITNVELNGFIDVPEVYSVYSRDQLNAIAAGGTLIVMQERRDGKVFVRHQISTDYSNGNLNTTELSLIKNLDSISFYFANRFAPYIGRYNLTDDLLNEISGVIKDGLSHLGSSTETNRLVGPQVLPSGTKLVALMVDPVEKDHAFANIALNLPKPFNNFDLRLQVI